MIIRPKNMHLLLPALALSVALVAASSAQAQHRRYSGSSGPAISLQINFGSQPHWVGVRGTSVREIRRSDRDRSDYDMFRYGRHFYAYNHENGRWYMSRRYQGRFVLIDDRAVPRELRRIPRDHWRNYPAAWDNGGYHGSDRDYRGSDRDYRGSDGYQGGTSATFQVTFGSRPRWSGISGSRVEVIPYSDRPNYDVFRFDDTYYAYNNSQWYSSTRESGQFARIDDRYVPSELSSVPREHWRNYPPAWGNNGGNPASNGNGNGRGNGRGRGDKPNGRGNN